jgi:hypothetical protein
MNVQLVSGQTKTFSVEILRPDLTPDTSYRGLAFPNGSNHAVSDDGSSKALIDRDTGTVAVRGMRPSPIGTDGTPDVSTYVLVVETATPEDPSRRVPVYLRDCTVNVRVVDPTASNFAYTQV